MKLPPATQALVNIRKFAMDHACFSQDHFHRRDIDGLATIGGDICDWTMIAILADDGINHTYTPTP